MFEIILTAGTTIVVSTISSIVTYAFSKKKYVAEIESIKANNQRSVLDYYQDHADYMEAENKKLREENQKYMNENFASKAEIHELKMTIQKLSEDIKALSEKVCIDHACSKRKTSKS